MSWIYVAHPVQVSQTYATNISSGSSVTLTDSNIVCITSIMSKYEIELASSNV